MECAEAAASADMKTSVGAAVDAVENPKDPAIALEKTMDAAQW